MAGEGEGEGRLGVAMWGRLGVADGRCRCRQSGGRHLNAGGAALDAAGMPRKSGGGAWYGACAMGGG